MNNASFVSSLETIESEELVVDVETVYVRTNTPQHHKSELWVQGRLRLMTRSCTQTDCLN